MVKADASRDYYADLEIPPTATEEEIKKAFRTLAKALHPDRNPGKEVDVVPKFQAVQAAHEILSDPEQKRKYDLERAKVKANAPTIPRRGPVPPTPSQFPPPPRRTAPTATRQDPFPGNINTNRPRQPQQPVNTEKYAPWARAGAQQWDKTKEESRSKADAFRGFQQMRPGRSPTRERFAPTPPPRPGHYSSATRGASFAPHSAGPIPNGTPPDRKSWDDFDKAGRFTAGTESSAGFPGLSRSQSTRKKQGFTPGEPGGDEPQAPRTSAYASYARGERPQASNPQSYFSEHPPKQSPYIDPQRPSPSPLRHSKSSPVVEEDPRSQRPSLERISTRYSSIGGERTDVSNGRLGRSSSSARNSPIDPRWHESGGEGAFPSRSQERRRRAPSMSPKSRPTPAHVDDTSSDSETSSDEDVTEARRAAWPPKAMPRPTRPTSGLTDLDGRNPNEGQPSTGQFPGTNYVKPPTAKEAENSRYPNRSGPPFQSQSSSQAAFNYVPSSSRSRYTPQAGVPGGGDDRSTRPSGAAVNGPKMYASPFPFPSQGSSPNFPSPSPRLGQTMAPLNGIPPWAVPSSVFPTNITAKKHALDRVRAERQSYGDSWRSRAFVPTPIQRPCRQGKFADTLCSHSPTPEASAAETRPPSFVAGQRHRDTHDEFSASEWNDKFAGAEDIFRPKASGSPGKRSPVRATTPRTRSHSRTQTSPVKESAHAQTSSGQAGLNETGTTAGAFAPGKFSAEQWAERLRFQTSGGPVYDDRAKIAKRGSQASASKRPPTRPRPGSSARAQGEEGEGEGDVTSEGDESETGSSASDDVDPMDLDEPTPRRSSATPSEVKATATSSQPNTGIGGPSPLVNTTGSDTSQRHRAASMNLDDLSKVAPLRPSDSGLGNLKELNNTLPFASRTSSNGPSIVGNGVPFSSLKAMNLPKAPRHVIPPLERLDQESWTRYNSEMSAYMREWHVFNQKVLAHFQARDAELSMTLMPNWTSALGDGPSGQDITRKLQEDSQSSGGQKAGYAAYREWMEEDMRVREWWNMACEGHRNVVLELGKVRERAKSLTSE